MQIGIITKHRIQNYGSFMQAYGLQCTLEKMGYQAELIDYIYPNSYHPTHKTLKSTILHLGNSLLKKLLPGSPGHKFNSRYAVAFRQYYHLSRLYKSREEIFANPPSYDVYIAGSDQIWRPEFTNGDSVFFADFAPKGKKRMSYASSFGCVTIPDCWKEHYATLLSKLDCISVRENSGVTLVKELSGRDAIQVVDPSLLLTGDEWRKLEIMPNLKRKYIACYGALEREFVSQLAHKMAGNDIDVVRINGKFMDYFKKSEHYILDAGPCEWLGLLDEAEMVIVGGSFHGTAFSIQFHKPFLSVLSGNANHDSRQLGLLRDLGLEEHGIYRGAVDTEQLHKIMYETNWDEIDNRLLIRRNKSIEYLKDSLHEV